MPHEFELDYPEGLVLNQTGFQNVTDSGFGGRIENRQEEGIVARLMVTRPEYRS